jgi:hypothetical protein
LVLGKYHPGYADCLSISFGRRVPEVYPTGTIPSGEVYGDYLGSATTFQYNVEFNLSFRLDPQLLPSLADEEGWLPENLPEQYEKIFQDFVNAVALDLRETYVTEDVAVDVMVGGPEYSQRIKGLFEERYPYFQGVEVNLVRFQIPDVTSIFPLEKFS